MVARLSSLIGVAVALSVAVASVGAGDAQAYRVSPNPVTVGGNWSTLQNALWNIGGTPCESGSSCTPAQTSALKLGRLKLLAPAVPLLRTLGTIGLATVAFETGWKIGSPLGGYIYQRLAVPNPSLATGTGSCLNWTFDVQSLVFHTSADAGGSGSWPIAGWYASIQSWQPSGTPNGSVFQVGNSSTCLSAYAATASAVPGMTTVATAGSTTSFVVPEATAETGFKDAPVPWVAQSTSATYTGANVLTGSATATTVRAALLVDEAAAEAAADAGDPDTEAATGAFYAGTLADPAWTGYPVGEMDMPDCLGLTEVACSTLLEADGWFGSIVGDTVLPEFADLDYPAGVIIGTVPAVGSILGLDGEVAAAINPAPEDYPFRLPQPNRGETYADYIERLQGLGWVGTATEVELSEAAGDPELGPSAPVTARLTPVGSATPTVLRMPAGWPSLGPLITPTTPIEFTLNPPGYPPLPDGGGGGVPDLDFSPITDIDFGCKFPYGLICYAVAVTELFDVTPDAPRFEFMLGTEEVGEAPYIVDLNVMDSYMAMIRTLIGVALWIGGVYFLAASLLGFRMGGDPAEAADEGLDWT